MSSLKFFKALYEKQGHLPDSHFPFVVASYEDEKLPQELADWIKGLNKPDFRNLYRICRENSVMPEVVLEWIDRDMMKAEAVYRKKQKAKGRPVQDPEEKRLEQLISEAGDIEFFLETREKIRGGMSLTEAVGRDETKERYYRKFKDRYNRIEAPDTDSFLRNWWKENL